MCHTNSYVSLGVFGGGGDTEVTVIPWYIDVITHDCI